MGSSHICLELTQNCNNACRHCYNFWRVNGRTTADSKGETLSRKEIRYLIEKVKKDVPLEYVALSGGEPLMNEELPQIVGDLVAAGLKPIIITNGVLLEEGLLKQLPQGMNFEITLFGHTGGLHDKLAGNRVFDRVVQNASRIRRYGSYFTVVFVATRLNALDIFRTSELGIALGASAIMYNRVNLSKGMKLYANKFVPTVNMLEESLGLLQEVVRKYGIPAFCSVPILPCLVDISRYQNINFGWCPRGGDNSYYTIGNTGLLRPCNHSSVILGDLLIEGFAEIISRKKCKDFWETIPTECTQCTHPLKDKCRGGCTAASDEFYGSQFRIDPVYELARGYK